MAVKSLNNAPLVLLGTRIPNRVQGQPFGAQPIQANQPRTNTLAGNSAALLQPGTAQGQEQFGYGMDSATARALNQIQRNIQEALGQVKSDPTANKQMHESLQLTQGTTDKTLGPMNPTIVNHGLTSPYRGYRICTVRGGVLTGHAALSPTQSNPSNTSLLLWTQFTPFVINGVTQKVLADIEVWA